MGELMATWLLNAPTSLRHGIAGSIVDAAGWQRHVRERDADPGSARTWYLIAEDPPDH